MKGNNLSLNGRLVVLDGENFERGLKKFKKKVATSGILLDLREREHYIKPTTRKKTSKNLAKRRWVKYLNEQALPKKMY